LSHDVGSQHPTVAPYGGFPAADGHLITGVMRDGRWKDFCDALELPELATREEFATNANRVANRGELEALIVERTAACPLDHSLGHLRARGLLAAPIRKVGEAVDDPATRQLGVFVPLAGGAEIVSPRLDGVRGHHPPERAPMLGEHTEEVLEELIGEYPCKAAMDEAASLSLKE